MAASETILVASGSGGARCIMGATLLYTFFEDLLLNAGTSMLVIFVLFVMSTPGRCRMRKATMEHGPPPRSVTPERKTNPARVARNHSRPPTTTKSPGSFRASTLTGFRDTTWNQTTVFTEALRTSSKTCRPLGSFLQIR